MAMRVVAFANNRVGWRVVQWLQESDHSGLAGLVIHPPKERAYGQEILEAVSLEDHRILSAPKLKEDSAPRIIESWDADVGLSLFFDYLLRPAIFKLFPEGCLNLHPSYLPYNRGVYSNVWSIVDGTPAGASLHYIDEGVDTGAILARKQVPKRPTDTGSTLYRRQENACVELFRRAWPDFVRGKIEADPQPEDGTYHRYADVEDIDRIDLDKEYTARELINRLRARTFPPYEGCYFEHQGRKIFLRLGLWDEEDYPPEDRSSHHDDRDGSGA